MSTKLKNIKTILDVHSYLENGSVNELVEEFFSRIEKHDSGIDSYVRLYPDRALAIAEKLDQAKKLLDFSELLEKYPLFGVPFAIKDNILVEDLPAYAQSKILEGYIAPYTADIVRLIEDAGGVLLGHTNMDEFAMGSSTEFSGFAQVTHNPLDNERVAGGTSGGSAAAVAAHMAVFAIGTDTGGSVRQPASFTGIFGLRPTWGLLSRYGIVAASSSFDQPGILAHTANDIEMILKVLVQPTTHDSTQNGTFTPQIESKKGLKIGVVRKLFDVLDPVIGDLFNQLLVKLEKEYTLQDVELPSTHYNLAAYYLLTTVEAASNLERYDGIRYGKQVDEGELFFSSRRGGFGKEVQRRIMLGTFASSAGYIDAYYGSAQKVRRAIRNEFEKALSTVDLLITPVSPFPPFKIGEKVTADPTTMYLADVMTISPALAGNASVSVPVGFVTVDGKQLPVGAQFIANPYREDTLLSFIKTV